MRLCLALLAAAIMAAPASAQIVVDGTVDASYGLPVSIQTVNTEFGDEDGINDPNGGELDAAYLAVEGQKLFIAISGNLETDSFNKLNLFIDSVAGGENTLAAQNFDFGDVGRNLGLVTFAPGFEADYQIYARAGGGNFETDIVDRLGGVSTDVLASTGTAPLSGDFGIAIGANDAALTANGSGVLGEAVSDGALAFALNNSNAAGVVGGSGAADPFAAAAVTTGVEFSIDFAELGLSRGDTVSFVAMYGNGDNNFISNQILGGLAAPQGNLGADGAGNFFGDASGVALDLSAATPFSITIPVPEPGSAVLVLMASAIAGALGMRRRLG
ncbi:MAG: PEP-CTERM sorting domain-containing protein [Planctomycetota bacterium]